MTEELGGGGGQGGVCTRHALSGASSASKSTPMAQLPRINPCTFFFGSEETKRRPKKEEKGQQTLHLLFPRLLLLLLRAAAVQLWGKNDQDQTTAHIDT